MVTENVDIRFRESGARVIRRRIDEIGEAANRSTRGIFLLQRAIFVLGGAGAVRALTSQVDLLTNVENRLRLTTDSAQNLEQVQTRLFQVARDSRTAFASVAEIYSRTALSVRQLGISQKETAEFTESLAKASILSGASTREANAALIQLSQGLASNRLSGDELRSVLEQLPFVADVIAKQLGITRGQLREFGRDGKISALVVLEAFRNARDEINRLFADTQPTISQALSVANTNWLEFLDNLDDTVLISQTVANAIIAISENLSGIINALTLTAGAFALAFGARQLQNIFRFIGGLRAGAVAVSRMAEVENLRAASSVRRAQASLAAANADKAVIAQGIVQLQQNRALLVQQQQSIIIDNQRRVARDALTGRFIAYDVALQKNIRTNIALARTERALTASRTQLTTATAVQTGATNTLAIANGRAAAAQAASSGVTATLTRTFPTLAGVIGLAARALSGLWGLLAANPIGAAVVLLGSLTFGITQFGDEVKITQDGVVNLQNFTVAAFQLMFESVRDAANSIKLFFAPAIDFVSDKVSEIASAFVKVMKSIIDIVKNSVNFIVALFVGSYNAVVGVWGLLPAAFRELGSKAINALIEIMESGINAIINAVGQMLSFIGGAATLIGRENPFANILDGASVNLSKFKRETTGALADVGTVASESFSNAFETDFVGNGVAKVSGILDAGVNKVIQRARRNANQAAEDLLFSQQVLKKAQEAVDVISEPETGSGSKGGISTDFAAEIQNLRDKISLEQQYGLQKAITNEQLRIENALKRELTSTEQALLEATVKELEVAKIKGEILESILGPQERLILGQEALNGLFNEGAISLENYTTKLREMQIAADQAAGTLQGGFRAAIASAIKSANQIGDALGGVVVGAANSASDAIVEFAKTGKFNVRQFFAELFAQLLKLAAQQLLLRFLGGFLGIPIAPIGFQNGGSILPSFATGGSIMPTGPGSTDTQLVAFNKRPDERVDILTPDQQARQNRNQNRRDTPLVSNEPPVVIVPRTDQEVFEALSSYEGRKLIIKGLKEENVI